MKRGGGFRNYGAAAEVAWLYNLPNATSFWVWMPEDPFASLTEARLGIA